MDFERNTRKLKKMLKNDGFTCVPSSGSQVHEKWVKGSRSVSMPRTKEIGPETTLRKIYEQAGWLKLSSDVDMMFTRKD